jgi:hypothetical protein
LEARDDKNSYLSEDGAHNPAAAQGVHGQNQGLGGNGLSKIPEGSGIAENLPDPSAGVNTPPVAALVAALGGTRAAARAIGIALSTLHNYASGKREAPPEVLGSLLAAAAKASTTTSTTRDSSPAVNEVVEHKGGEPNHG